MSIAVAKTVIKIERDILTLDFDYSVESRSFGRVIVYRPLQELFDTMKVKEPVAIVFGTGSKKIIFGNRAFLALSEDEEAEALINQGIKEIRLLDKALGVYAKILTKVEEIFYILEELEEISSSHEEVVPADVEIVPW
jgi:hypothetical protein